MVTLQWCNTLPSPFSYSLRPGNHICCLATALWQYHNLGILTIKMLWQHWLASLCTWLNWGTCPYWRLLSSQGGFTSLFAGLMNLYLELRSNIEVALWKYIHITVFRLKNEVISYMLAHFWQNSISSMEGLMRIGFTGKSSRVWMNSDNF